MSAPTSHPNTRLSGELDEASLPGGEEKKGFKSYNKSKQLGFLTSYTLLFGLRLAVSAGNFVYFAQTQKQDGLQFFPFETHPDYILGAGLASSLFMSIFFARYDAYRNWIYSWRCFDGDAIIRNVDGKPLDVPKIFKQKEVYVLNHNGKAVLYDNATTVNDGESADVVTISHPLTSKEVRWHDFVKVCTILSMLTCAFNGYLSLYKFQNFLISHNTTSKHFNAWIGILSVAGGLSLMGNFYSYAYQYAMKDTLPKIRPEGESAEDQGASCTVTGFVVKSFSVVGVLGFVAQIYNGLRLSNVLILSDQIPVLGQEGATALTLALTIPIFISNFLSRGGECQRLLTSPRSFLKGKVKKAFSKEEWKNINRIKPLLLGLTVLSFLAQLPDMFNAFESVRNGVYALFTEDISDVASVFGITIDNVSKENAALKAVCLGISGVFMPLYMAFYTLPAMAGFSKLGYELLKTCGLVSDIADSASAGLLPASSERAPAYS